jgi:hypothetical protein
MQVLTNAQETLTVNSELFGLASYVGFPHPSSDGQNDPSSDSQINKFKGHTEGRWPDYAVFQIAPKILGYLEPQLGSEPHGALDPGRALSLGKREIAGAFTVPPLHSVMRRAERAYI